MIEAAMMACLAVRLWFLACGVRKWWRMLPTVCLYGLAVLAALKG